MHKHRYIRWFVAIGVGIVLSLFAYEKVTDPEPERRRLIETAVVLDARELLASYVLPGGGLQLVDPLSPNRKIGKTYLWPNAEGWEVSGFYRRNANDRWHPYLMNLDSAAQLKTLAVRDSNERLIGMSAQDPKFSAVP